jgi:hypothetical protein
VIPIRSIQLAFIASTLTPATINPGGGADVSVTVRNNGALAATSANATMFSLSPYISVNNANATYAGLPTGVNASNPVNQRFHITSNVRSCIST